MAIIMNWFKKHLNWTFIIFGLIPPILFIIPLVIYSVLIGIYAPQQPPIPLTLLVWMAGIATYMGGGAWLLSEKGRSPWWVLLLILNIIGIFVLLLLKNENTKERQIQISNSSIGRTVIWSILPIWCIIGLRALITLQFGTFIAALVSGCIFALFYYGFTTIFVMPKNKFKLLWVTFSALFLLIFIFTSSQSAIAKVSYTNGSRLFEDDVVSSMMAYTIATAFISIVLASIVYGIHKYIKELNGREQDHTS
jgi:hypothetical protein